MGSGGALPVDIEALIDILVRFSTLAGDLAVLVEEIDVTALVAVGAPVVPGKAE